MKLEARPSETLLALTLIVLEVPATIGVLTEAPVCVIASVPAIKLERAEVHDETAGRQRAT